METESTPPSVELATKPTRNLQGKPPPSSPSSGLILSREMLKRERPIRTAWPKMQRLLQPCSGQFWVVGGNPGNYKTQTVWNLALDMASLGQRILFVTLEISTPAMCLKAVSRYSRIPLDRLRAAGRADEHQEFLSGGEMEAAVKAEERLSGLDLRLRLHGEESGRTTRDVLSTALRNRYDAVFVDHLGMMAREGADEYRETANAVDSFRALAHGELAKEYRPLVCLLSPLKRVEEADDDRLPQMSDLRGSQRIESDADIVMILQKRPRKDDCPGEDVVDGYVVKNRDGQCPVVVVLDANGATCTVNERPPQMPLPPQDADEPAEDWRDR